MKGIGFAPSPNWYCTKVSDCSSSGIFAFGAKQDVFLLDIAVAVPCYTGTLIGHNDKIVGLKFCPNIGRPHELASVDENGRVKIWDISAKTVLVEFSVSKNKITCLEWSSRESDIILTGDEKGIISVYSACDGMIEHTVHKNQITSLILSDCDAQLLIVGFREGLILVVNLKTFSIIHSMRRHENDVQCLNWIPHSFNRSLFSRTSETYEGELLFASSSKDGTIRLWNANQGKLLTTFKLPPPSGYRAKYHDGQARSRLWSALSCVSHWKDTLICSGYNGELLLCNFQGDGKCQWEVLNKHEGPVHQNIIFNISNYKMNLITTSIDRQIIVWDLNEKKSQISLPTLGGFVYCVQFSPIDIGSLAVGVGDNLIRVWNLQPSQSSYQVETLWQGIKAKVTAIAWHPKQEGILAFGTEEGRVGIFNLLSSRTPKISDSHHRSTVYSISWGPVFSSESKTNKKDDFNLYTCGGGEILLHNPKNLQHTAQNINTLITSNSSSGLKTPSRSELSWREDMVYLAIGNEDGSIEILRAPNLANVLTITELRKQIQCLCWHPMYTSSTELSACSFWLAAVGCGSTVHVFDLKQELDMDNSQNDSVKGSVVNKISCKLDGHKNRVVSLCWSPHTNGQLASASYDGTAQIWDVIHKKPVSNYRGHRGRIFSLAWSLLYPDVVFTGGEDFTLQQWNILKQEFICPPKKSTEKKNKKNKKQKAEVISESNNVSTSDMVIDTTIMDELQELLEKKKMELQKKQSDQDCIVEKFDVMVAGKSVTNEQSPLQECHKIEASEENTTISHESTTKKKKRKKYKSLFPLSSTLENRGKAFTLKDVYSLFLTKYKPESTVSNSDSIETNKLEESDIKTNKTSENNIVSSDSDIVASKTHLGLFTTRPDAFRMINSESQHHKENGNWENVLYLEIWKGNIGKAIEIAYEQNHLTDWLVALAPLGSYDLWKKVSRMYSEQLIKEGQPLRASLYLLAIHDVYGAIDLLKTHASYKEALGLARARLSPDDPKLHELIEEWKESLIKEENFEGAAKCLISLGNLKDAVEILSRRSDPSMLKLAASLSLESGDLIEAKLLALKSIQLYQGQNDWDSAYAVINQHTSLQNYQIFLSIHKFLHEKINLLKSDFSLWQLKCNVDVENVCLWEVIPNSKPLLETLLDKWTTESSLLTSSEDAVKIYNWMQDHKSDGQILMKTNEIIMQIAYHLTLSLVAFISENIPLTLSNIMEILNLCENDDSSFLLQVLCRLVFPNGIADVDKLSKSLQFSHKINSSVTVMIESIKAYYCLSVLYFLKNIKLPSSDNKLSNEDAIEKKDYNSLDDFCKFQTQFGESSISTRSNLHSVREHLIDKLKMVFLDDHRAERNILELELKYVNNSIARALAHSKIEKKNETKTNKTSSNSKDYSESSVNNKCSDIIENNITPADSEVTDNRLSNMLFGETNIEVSDKNLMGEEQLFSIVEAKNTNAFPVKNNNESEMDGFSEMSSIIDYLLPCDERYTDVSLSDLQKEQVRIEEKLALAKIPEDHHFPNLMKTAEMLVQYCQNNELEKHKLEVIEWALKYAPLKQTKENFHLM